MALGGSCNSETPYPIFIKSGIAVVALQKRTRQQKTQLQVPGASCLHYQRQQHWICHTIQVNTLFF